MVARRKVYTYLLKTEVTRLRMRAKMAANLASYARPDPKRFPTRTAVAIPILCGIWNRIEENDNRIELTASATGPSKDTLRERPSQAHHSEDTMIVPIQTIEPQRMTESQNRNLPARPNEVIVPNFRKASLRSNPPQAVLGAKKVAYPMETSALKKAIPEGMSRVS
jgi:hypothetical protein